MRTITLEDYNVIIIPLMTRNAFSGVRIEPFKLFMMFKQIILNENISM